MDSTENILNEIYRKLYLKDIDKSIKVFLCGASAKLKTSLREIIYSRFKKNPQFNIIYPETVFRSLYGKGGYNLLELEDELATLVDVIVIPLEGIGTFCELGAFAVNPTLLPKLIAINDEKYSRKRSFITDGPIDLVKKNKNLISYKADDLDKIPKLLEARIKRIKPKHNNDVNNIFNLSRLILYLIALFQPVSQNELLELLEKLDTYNSRKQNLASAINILFTKSQIKQSPGLTRHEIKYLLSEEGHKYFFEDLLDKLEVRSDFTRIRSNIVNRNFVTTRRKWDNRQNLLALVHP